MDVYGAEKHLKKLFSYIQDVADNKPYMYQKSKDRLRGMAVTCNEVVKLISEILQDETLQQEGNEFEDFDKEAISTFVSSVESELVRLRSFIDVNELPQEPAKQEYSKMSSHYRKQVLLNYRISLKSMSEYTGNNRVVKDICSLLWRWFDIRFYSSLQTHPKFRYNIRRMRSWVVSIILCYAKHIMNGTESDFFDMFDDWFKLIESSEAGNKYAVPYEVYVIDKSISPSDVTLTAVVLYDVLLDCGLDKLCLNDPFDIYFNDSYMYDICAELNPTELDGYVNYKEDDKVLDVCKIGGVSDK